MIRRQARPGFSLIELLVVIAIIGVLAALTLSAVQKVRSASQRTQCANNLRQIGLALQHYHDANNTFPPGVSYRDGQDPYPFLSWSARLLPYLEQSALWVSTEQAFTQNQRFLVNPPHIGLSTVMPVFFCPSDARPQVSSDARQTAALTSYLGVEGKNQFRQDGVLFLDSRIRIGDISDGTSNTLMVGERPASTDLALGWWYAGEGQGQDGSADSVLGVQERNVQSDYGRNCPIGPYEFGPGNLSNQCDAFHFWSLHSGGAHFLLADGSVRLIPYSAAPIILALASRAGGEAVELP